MPFTLPPGCRRQNIPHGFIGYVSPAVLEAMAAAHEELLHMTAVRRLAEIGISNNPDAIAREELALRRLFAKL